MHATTTTTLTLALAAAATMSAGASQPIPEPDLVLFGGITIFGVPVAPTDIDVVVIVVREGDNPSVPANQIVTYTVGSNPAALVDVDGDQVLDAGYLLRIPLEHLPPGAAPSGNAIVIGDTVDVYILDPPSAPALANSFTPFARGLVQGGVLAVGATSCTADCDGSGDGQVGINDLLALLADWNQPGPCNLDGTGTIGITDLLEMLSQWGPCR